VVSKTTDRAEGAANGVAGTGAQRERPADVIVTDIFMP